MVDWLSVTRLLSCCSEQIHPNSPISLYQLPTRKSRSLTWSICGEKIRRYSKTAGSFSYWFHGISSFYCSITSQGQLSCPPWLISLNLLHHCTFWHQFVALRSPSAKCSLCLRDSILTRVSSTVSFQDEAFQHLQHFVQSTLNQQALQSLSPTDDGQKREELLKLVAR